MVFTVKAVPVFFSRLIVWYDVVYTLMLLLPLLLLASKGSLPL